MNSKRNYALYILSILFAVNLLNYVDRQVLFAVFPLIKSDFNLSDTSLGLLGSAFMFCYMISAPLLGWLGDRVNRMRLSSIGLILWSCFTALAGFAPTYRALLWARSLVGIGEASFSTNSPPLLADYFPRDSHGRVYSIFYLAIPAGSALGYICGGILGENFGWRYAFFMVGIPGLILAIPLWFAHEQARGDGATEKHIAAAGEYLSLLKNRPFILNTLAMAAMTFAMGGLAQWMPTFFYRVHHVGLVAANTLLGGIVVTAGIAGALTGGWIGDRLERKMGATRGHLLVSGLGVLFSAPIAFYALISPSFPLSVAAMFAAAFLIFLNSGPLNAVLVNVTGKSVRSMAFAVNIFLIHALGDALSPAFLGWLSDLWGLRTALMAAPAALLVSAFICWLCARSIDNEGLPGSG